MLRHTFSVPALPSKNLMNILPDNQMGISAMGPKLQEPSKSYVLVFSGLGDSTHHFGQVFFRCLLPLNQT